MNGQRLRTVAHSALVVVLVPVLGDAESRDEGGPQPGPSR